MSEKKEKILIVGGGLSGSLLAICLAKRGFEIELYERRGDMRKGSAYAGKSINLALSTRGIEALKKVGLAEQVLHDAIPMSGRMMHSVTGELTYQPYGKEGQYINSVSRAGLNLKLIELADAYDNVKLFFNSKCIDANLETNEVSIQLENGEIKHTKGDVVFGSDGAFSAIRSEMQKTNRFNYSQVYENYGYKELEILPSNMGQFPIEENALHIWPRGEFMMIALPNPGGSFTCTLFLPYEGALSFEKLKTKEDVKLFFETYFADALPIMPQYLEDFFENPIGNLVTVKCNPWVKNKFALVGDAAHAIIPFYGQGMNCSFEDVKELDEIIEQDYPNWEIILEKYQQARIVNANAIADLACKNFVEMRDLVGKKEFMQFKHIEHELCDLYPDYFKSQYELVTFNTSPYHLALQQGGKNEALIKYIIDNNLEIQLSNKEVILPLIKKYN
jgi:kynurenine 3-monooxygenase